MVKESLLERYVDNYGKGDDYYNIFKRFGDATPSLSDKSKHDYTRDMYKVLAVKFFNFWDFDKKFGDIAVNLGMMHLLDKADVAVYQGKEDYSECEELYHEVVEKTEQGKFFLGSMRTRKKMLPSKLGLQRKKSGGLAKRLAGNDFRLYQNKGNVVMRLRPVDQPEEVRVKIRNQDRTMLDFVFAHYDEHFDSDFWPDVFSEEKIGQVLGFLEKNGRTKTKKTGNMKNTIARKMSSLLRFEKYLFQKELVEKRIMPDMDKPKKIERPQIFLDEKDFRKVYNYLDGICKDDSVRDRLYSIRDRAIIGLLDITCARGSAIAGLKMEDIDMKNKEVYIREKGRAENVVPIEGVAFDYLREFLRVRGDFIDKFEVHDGAYVFHSKFGAPMDRKSLSRNVNKAFEEAGVKKKVGKKNVIGSHVIRRSSANALDKAGAPVHHIQKLMNHRHTGTTERYISLGPLDNKKTVKKYHPRAK